MSGSIESSMEKFCRNELGHSMRKLQFESGLRDEVCFGARSASITCPLFGGSLEGHGGGSIVVHHGEE